MKKLVLYTSILFPLFGVSQRQGVITYEAVVQMDMSRFPEEFRDRMPTERKSEKQLLFKGDESQYKHLRNIRDEDRERRNSGVDNSGWRPEFRVRGSSIGLRGMGADRNEFYTNSAEGLLIEKTDFFGRTFLIEEEQRPQWKVSNEVRMIADYQCIKATTMNDTIRVTAWFTPQIAVSLGPGSYVGLPGLILKVDLDNGRIVYTATNIELRELTVDEVIEKPVKGKKVSREAFNEIQEEKMAEMEDMMQSNFGRSRRGN